MKYAFCATDGKVGFYDLAMMTFLASSGTGDFTAGAVTNDTPHCSAVKMEYPPSRDGSCMEVLLSPP